MRMTEIPFEGATPIDGYAPGGFRVGGAWRPGSLLITAAWWETLDAASPDDVSPDGLASVIRNAHELDVLLVGTGAEIAQIPGREPAGPRGSRPRRRDHVDAVGVPDLQCVDCGGASDRGCGSGAVAASSASAECPSSSIWYSSLKMSRIAPMA